MSAPSLAPRTGQQKDLDTLLARFQRIRASTEQLASPLEVEDYVVQSMPDVSPTKWHLAHVTWFFETFVLMPHLNGYQPLNPAYQYLFNSYYLGAGERHCRDQRGYISRPTVAEVYEYRRYVNEAMGTLLAEGAPDMTEVARVIEIGLQHEQQHQELLLTDIKHVLSVNPLRPVYRDRPQGPSATDPVPSSLNWVSFDEGLVEIGAPQGAAFTFDNEGPRHRFFVDAFQLANRPTTNAEYTQFMEDGGYERGEFWLSEGWAMVREKGWSEPFYWEWREGAWHTFTLAGPREVDPAEPVCHLSYFEADAFARWAGARLPSEQEWEIAAACREIRGNLANTTRFHPERIGADSPTSGVAPALANGSVGGESKGPSPSADTLQQLYGDVWEWTRSQYSPYPGYETLPGTLGEYNGKFMSNQFVLRGGSCATPADHIRTTYRNFFPADASWQFSGIRLARDAS